MKQFIIRGFGFAFIVFGIILFINGISNFTGFVIIENDNYKGHSISGIFLIIIGVIILKIYRIEYSDESEPNERVHFKGRRELRAHNHQAHYAARRHFMENYGRLPDKEELKAYTRGIHEKGNLKDLVREYTPHKHKKSA